MTKMKAGMKKAKMKRKKIARTRNPRFYKPRRNPLPLVLHHRHLHPNPRLLRFAIDCANNSSPTMTAMIVALKEMN
jgi:hypothetical protein